MKRTSELRFAILFSQSFPQFLQGGGEVFFYEI